MIKFKPLNVLEPGDIRSLNTGYASNARYAVRKTETHQYTTITLDLVNLEQPYVRHWDTPDEDLQRYQQIVQQGFSLAAYDGEQMVGIAITEPRHWNRTLWVWEFHVAESHRRTGIGTRLMDALAQIAGAAGLRALVCETQSTNLPAISFYRAAGFEIDGVDLSYYTNHDAASGEVAIFMKRKIE